LSSADRRRTWGNRHRKVAARRSEGNLGQEDVCRRGTDREATCTGRLECVGRGKIGGTRKSRDVGASGSVHSDARGDIEVCYKSIVGGLRRRPEGIRSDWEVDGLGFSRHVNVAAGVQGDGTALVMVASPEQGRENERRAYGIQLSHERVLGTVKRFLEGAGRGPKVGRIG